MATNEILAKRIIEFQSYFGYFDSQVIPLVRKRPELLNLSTFDLDQKMKNFKTYGWSKYEVGKAILKNPGILTMHNEDLLEKVLTYKDLGLSQYVIEQPAMLNCPVKDLKFKYMIAKVYGLENSFFPKSNKLGLQSINKTFARLQYFIEYKIEDLKDIFLTENDFIEKYKFDSNRLISLYPLTKSGIKQISRIYEKNSLAKPEYANIELTNEELEKLVFKVELKSLRQVLKDQKNQKEQ